MVRWNNISSFIKRCSYVTFDIKPKTIIDKFCLKFFDWLKGHFCTVKNRTHFPLLLRDAQYYDRSYTKNELVNHRYQFHVQLFVNLCFPITNLITETLYLWILHFFNIIFLSMIIELFYSFLFQIDLFSIFNAKCSIVQ